MTPRFTAVLRLYHEREEQAKIALGRLEAARQPLVEAIDAIAQERQAATHLPVVPALRETLLAFCTAAELRQRQARERLLAHEQLIEKARTVLAEAHRARTTIEKLRAKDAAAAQRQHDRREQRRLDEFAARHHLMKLGA